MEIDGICFSLYRYLDHMITRITTGFLVKMWNKNKNEWKKNIFTNAFFLQLISINGKFL